MPASFSIARIACDTSTTLTITPSLIASRGHGVTAALASSQPLAVGTISTALMQLEPMSIPAVDSLPKSEPNTTPYATSFENGRPGPAFS